MDNREQLTKCKIACAETGIEIHHTLCAICSPSYNCGVNAYVKNGKLLKVEGTDEHPRNHGILCAKGQSNRQFIYRKDRLPLPFAVQVSAVRANLSLSPGTRLMPRSPKSSPQLKTRAVRIPSFSSAATTSGTAPGSAALHIASAPSTTAPNLPPV